eukprot:PhM_4_TR16748/c2_g4_i3/m.79516
MPRLHLRPLPRLRGLTLLVSLSPPSSPMLVRGVRIVVPCMVAFARRPCVLILCPDSFLLTEISRLSLGPTKLRLQLRRLCSVVVRSIAGGHVRLDREKLLGQRIVAGQADRLDSFCGAEPSIRTRTSERVSRSADLLL